MSSIALVLDGVLLEVSPAGHGLGHFRAGGRAGATSRHSSTASQRLLATGAGGGVGGTSMSVAAAAVSPSSVGNTLSATTSSSLPYYITIPEERFLAVREKAIEVAQLVGNARNDADYQVSAVNRGPVTIPVGGVSDPWVSVGVLLIR